VLHEADTLADAPIALALAQSEAAERRTVQAGLYGAVVVRALTAAVPIAAIREVVPRPAALLPFPGTRDDIVGAIDLRGALVPVLDPAGLFRTGDTAACPVILVLRHAGRVIGMIIESIVGVLSLDPADLTYLDIGGDGGSPKLLQAAFVQGDMRGMVLDVEALAALEAIPFAVERSLVATRQAGVTSGLPTLLFTAGGVRLGLAAHAIEASVPEQRIVPSPIEDELWLGSLMHNGHRVPVIDTLRFLGLGAGRRTERVAAVIVRLPCGHRVGLQIEAVDDMLRVRPDEIKPLQQFMVGNYGLFAGLYGVAAPTLLLDPQAVRADLRLGMIGRLCGRDDVQSAATGERRATLEAFLLVRLGQQRLALPMEQVEEIIATKPTGSGLVDHQQAIADFIVHRGRAVPLIDLNLALGFSDEAVIGAFTVLVSADGNQAGFMVDELCAVERSAVQRLRDAGSAKAVGRVAATIRTPEGACSIVDLRSLVRSLCTLPPS
jgi:purine-binding chemotaxis protein CheW